MAEHNWRSGTDETIFSSCNISRALGFGSAIPKNEDNKPRPFLPWAWFMVEKAFSKVQSDETETMVVSAKTSQSNPPAEPL